MHALEILLAHVVDYAGLFPPAALDVPEAARQFAQYRAGAERWMLGRFVAPAARLGALAEAIAEASAHAVPTHAAAPNGDGAPWPVAVLASVPLEGPLGPWDADVAHMQALDASGRAKVQALELRGATALAMPLARQAADAVGVAPSAAFVEIPWDADHDALAAAARPAGVSLKLRTGGITPDAFPGAEVVTRFVAACVARGVSFKLTAGLHHAVRGEHPLTYEPGCAHGTMHGFLNVLAATALLCAGHDAGAVASLLAERDAAAITFGDVTLRWRELTAGPSALAAARRAFTAFGSCSFAEPVAELRALGLLGDAA